MDCKHLAHMDREYVCRKYPKKTSAVMWKFPYDNTTCKMFEEKE